MLVTPYANSCRFALPTIAQPDCRSRLITCASSEAGTSGRITPPAVVTIPCTSTRSLTATAPRATCSSEPPPADQVAEMIRRYVMFQASNFMVTGAAEFPKATEPSMHTEILMKARFFPIVDATVTIFGVAGKSWTQPNIWVNRDLMLAVYLG